MESYDRYTEGTPVLLQGQKATVMRDYGTGATRTIEVRTATGRTLAVGAFSIKRDPNPESQVESPVITNTTAPKMTSQVIYQFTKADGAIVYGTYIATNKVGNILLNPVNGGDVIEAPANAVEEVRPWTFKAVDDTNGNVVEFIQKPDAVRVGELIMPMGGGMLRVVKTNTQSRTASTFFKGRRFATEDVNAEPETI